MRLIKTLLGQQALKERRGDLTPRQRSAFILFDGQRSVSDVLDATTVMGITEEDVEIMIRRGLLAPAVNDPAPPPATPESNGAPEFIRERTPKERYQDAYPIATALTGSLGLRGFTLNLAVEATKSYEDLAALAPKIRTAVGDARFLPLKKALFA